MNCSKIRHDLIAGISNEEVEEHLAECSACRDLNHEVNSVMALLEMDVKVPENLASSILEQRRELVLPRVRKLSFSSIIQIAAAILFGVFIGHKFGKIANTQTTQINQNPINQYFEAHHFNVDHADFRATSLYNNN